ncbi:unnamed protein product [Prunus armeniaca]
MMLILLIHGLPRMPLWGETSSMTMNICELITGGAYTSSSIVPTDVGCTALVCMDSVDHGLSNLNADDKSVIVW